MHDEWFELAKAEMLARNAKLREETIDLDGSTQNYVAHAIAICADEAEERFRRELDGLFLDTAAGDQLTRWVADRYAIQRYGTTSARAASTFSRTGEAEAELPAGTIIVTADGIRFALDEAVYWAEDDDADKTGVATAGVAGPDGNVPADTEVSIEGASPDPTITVALDGAAAGGGIEESDEELRERVRDTEARAVRGIARAILLAALDVEGVRTASFYEAVDEEGLPVGGGVLVVGDAAGRANALLTDAVQEALYEYRPVGGYVDVIAGVPVELTIGVTALWSAGYATPANRIALRDAIVARVNRLPVRSAPAGAASTEYAESIFGQSRLDEVRPLIAGLIAVTLDLPVGSVAPDQGECLRTRPALVSVS